MTFQEWQYQYPGVSVQEVTSSPGVFIVQNYLLPNGPLADLRALSDYWVTSEMLSAHYGPTVWVSPRDEAKTDWTRADYMGHRVSHQRYYETLADTISRDAIERIVVRVFPLAKIRAALASGDTHLNSLPLDQWDRAYVPGCNTLCDSVCVLKAAAIRMAASDRASGDE